MPMHRARQPLPMRRGYGILVGLLRPKSRGEVHIASIDPRDAPLIDPRFLSDPNDIAPIAKGVEIARTLLGASAFADLHSTELLPGSEIRRPSDLEDFIRQNCVTVHHPVGTCRMGSDDGSATDPALRVRGLDGLRVADASVMPRLIGGNTAAAVIMIAEKASDFILNRPAPAMAG